MFEHFFLLTNYILSYYNRPVFLPKSVAGLYVTFIVIHTYFSTNISHFAFQILIW